jgi:5-methyltetrahydropteroyltriglutamate--homocysteine methyltransferase
MSKPKNRPPFRADHVGSLLRPEKLARARAQWEAGEIPPDELKAVEDACVLEAIAMQEGAGLRGITDGDFRRNDWFLDFMFSLDGIERGGAGMEVHFSGGLDWTAPTARITGRVRCPEGGIMVEAFAFLKAATRETAKICIPAPAMFHTIVNAEVVKPVYGDEAEFWSDLGQGYADAVAALGRAGCTYLQIDDVNAANLGDPKWQDVWRQRGRSAQEMVDSFVAANNAALSGRPEGMTAAVHMCRGNYQSQYAAEGSYDLVADNYFNRMAVDAVFMEYDDSRSGGFEPLRFMPQDKYVVLGLMTSKRPELEDRDTIKRRIDEAARYVDLDRLCLSPQCGFASTKEGNRLTRDEQAAKLAHLVSIATDVWGGV